MYVIGKLIKMQAVCWLVPVNERHAVILDTGICKYCLR